MIAVIFELQPHPHAALRYFDIAAELRPFLEACDGFISVERFERFSRPGHYVPLSFGRDEEAVRRWRCRAEHRYAQHERRDSVFASYRLRVAAVSRDYGLNDRSQAPPDSLQALT